MTTVQDFATAYAQNLRVHALERRVTAREVKDGTASERCHDSADQLELQASIVEETLKQVTQ